MKKKILSIFLASLTVVSLTACGGGGDVVDATKTTVVECINFNGGVGQVWLDNAAKRFEALKKDETYEDGKTGVKINITSEIDLRENTLSSSGYNIYFNEHGLSPTELSQRGLLLNINDIVTGALETIDGEEVSIEDKLQEDFRSALKGADGNYYALPHYEWYPGVIYDVETFDTFKLYFADASASASETFATPYGTANFVTSLDNAVSKKTCGNDGVYGTEDDGLPTTLQELLILCAKMTKHGVVPFTVAGFHTDYTAYLQQGLLAAFLGYDGMMDYFDFNGTADVVTGYSNDNLFKGVDYIKAPNIQENATITEETGYLTRDIAARYYIAALMEIIYKQDWLSQDSKNSATHTDTQYNFVFGGAGNKKRIGMLMEGSYWYNEAENAEIFSDYEAVTAGKTKKLGWMSLPTSLNTPVTEGNGKAITLMDTGNSFTYINANTARNAGVTKACKEFLQFLYTDAELKAFTATTGVAKAAVRYDVTDESILSELTEFQQSVITLKSKSQVVYANATNATFKAGRSNFMFSIQAPIWNPIINSVPYICYLDAYRAGYKTKDVFEATQISAATWANTYYKGA